MKNLKLVLHPCSSVSIRGNKDAFMKKLFIISVALLLALTLCGVSSAQEAQPLTSFDFTIVGVGLNASPEYQAVPKGIATQVLTNFFAPGFSLSPEVINQLPKDFQVKADLTGPGITARELSTMAGKPFNLPSLSFLGKYTLGNIRLFDGAGKFLFNASPQAVTIESISDPLITSVTTRQLTIDEIRDRGVVVDSTNFTAYNFTAVLGTSSSQVPVSFPVLIPNSSTQKKDEELPPPTDLGVTPPVINTLPDLPENIVMRYLRDAVVEIA